MNIKSDRHKPNRFLLYRDIHNNALKELYKSDFVGNDNLVFEPSPGEYCLNGEISCLGNILISVNKSLTILDECPENPLVQTIEYSYNASIQGYGNILRYDNQDHFHYLSRSDHFDHHHKHEFDWLSGKERKPESPFWIGTNNWPTLGDVIWELHHWYYFNFSELNSPEIYAQLGRGH